VEVSVEKPGTPEELAHHGVKGMKWGVRRSQATREFDRKFPTSRERTGEITRARRSMKGATKTYRKERKGKTKEEKKALKMTLLSHPDRATSLRMTRGEKFAVALLAAAPGSNVPLAAALTVRVGVRKGLED
jgi:hypothetical protein